MKNSSLRTNAFVPCVLTVAIAILTGCSGNTANTSASNAEIDSLRNQIKELTAGSETIAKNLITFDTLDFTVFSNQQWTRLHESHDKDIKVNWPDGHYTTGIDKPCLYTHPIHRSNNTPFVSVREI